MSLDDPRVRIAHMVEAANEAVSFASGRSREDIDTDRMLFHALVRCLEIIGEAATNIPEQWRARHHTIPWSKIVGTRNRVIHGYPEINRDIIWETCVNELPKLIAKLEAMTNDSELRSPE